MFHMFVLFCLYWWRLTGVFVESVSVMEGDSVTLNSDLSEIRESDEILWKSGVENSLIAEINRPARKFSTYYGPDGRFRDRLKLDNQTGSLTIMNITTEHEGHYELEINGAMWSSKTFSVSVYARLPVPVIIRVFSPNLTSSSSQNCSLVCSSSVLSVCDATLSWYKGIRVLSSISVCDLSISLSLPLEVEYQDKNTYSCVLNNPISKQMKNLNITQLCQHRRSVNQLQDLGLPLLYIVLISAAGCLMIVAVVVIFCICKKCRKTVETRENDRMDSVLCKPKSHKTKPKMEAVYENVPKR
ncbi:T-cell surface antigen CD2-like [Pimephales promelas]|uniref:T-cell surface antigen CD2-like n=1 Tax=Pimephales promelas TaxID=90988 RepID=UPI001955ECDA|nr:T-cell surface antigen CD2-like [Pimephales promelas]